MTEQELKIYAAEIEATLVVAFLPSFLNYVVNEDYIHVVIASPQFKNMSIADRTSLVFAKLRQHDPEVLKNTTVIVEAYTTKQIEDLIEYYL